MKPMAEVMRNVISRISWFSSPNTYDMVAAHCVVCVCMYVWYVSICMYEMRTFSEVYAATSTDEYFF
jgi:hypothetical protein